MAEAELAWVEPSDQRGAAGRLSTALTVDGRLRVADARCVVPARVDVGGLAEDGRLEAPAEPPPTNRERAGAGSVLPRVGPPEPGVWGPPDPGMSSQYWFCALAPEPAQGAPGAPDGGDAASAGAGRSRAALHTPAISRRGVLPGRVCEPCRPRRLTSTGHAS